MRDHRLVGKRSMAGSHARKALPSECEAGNGNTSCALRSPRLDKVARVVCFRVSPTFLFVTAIASSGMVGMVVATKDRKSTRLNSSHGYISYAVFCLKKKKQKHGVSYICVT